MEIWLNRIRYQLNKNAFEEAKKIPKITQEEIEKIGRMGELKTTLRLRIEKAITEWEMLTKKERTCQAEGGIIKEKTITYLITLGRN